ncbi:nicotinamide riboside transporter PnuC [bacterium]|nr:MAG: nicotinamide riboside transporter PnuC [bacterium]
MLRTDKIAAALFFVIAVVLLGAAFKGAMPWTEVLGALTGAAGVYLTVKRSIWNFPIGLANNLFFGILFFESRLYNDMGLQVVYFVLGVWGWAVWAQGLSRNEVLPIGRAGWPQLVGCLVFIGLGTFVMTRVATYWGGASPFWDALTTAICLGAQYMLGRKWLENWGFWLLADIIYVPLYLSRGLYLTSVLYFGFGCLCVMGFLGWLKQWELERKRDDIHPPEPPITIGQGAQA